MDLNNIRTGSDLPSSLKERFSSLAQSKANPQDISDFKNMMKENGGDFQQGGGFKSMLKDTLQNSMNPNFSQRNGIQNAQRPQTPQTTQESGKPQTTQEPEKPQTTQESGKSQTAQESGKPQSTQESGKPQTTQEPEKPQTTQESGKPQATQEIGKPLTGSDLDELQRMAQGESNLTKTDQPVQLSDLFAMMQGSGAMQNVGNAVNVAQVTPGSPIDPTNMEALVSRILVGANQAGNQEVRLTINDSILRNTEITVSRDAAGNLTIRIQCNDAASFQSLVASRQELQKQLDSREKGLVSIDLQNQNDEANDTNQRSRGLDENNYGYGENA